MAERVLYIGSPFFGYYRHIIAEFEARGYAVDYYNDRPSENSLIKGMQKIRKGMTAKLVEHYFDRIMSETNEIEYGFVFIMNCKAFTYDMITKLRASQPKARFVLYMWDTFALYPDAVGLIPLFDRAYSFDPDDCERYRELTLLPLFYTRPYERIGADLPEEKDIRYDLVSVCTAHPNRYALIKELFPLLQSKGIRIFSYLYINRLQYLYNKMNVGEFKSARAAEFRFKPLSEQDNLDVLRMSDTVFDVQHNLQSGLTMRTIETVGARRKLITMNVNIRKFDIYDDNNVYVLSADNWDGIVPFLRRKYQPIPEATYKKYSISTWIDTILS